MSGKYLWCSASDRRITIWDIETRKPLQEIETTGTIRTQLGFSERVLILAQDGNVGVWEYVQRTGAGLLSTRPATVES